MKKDFYCVRCGHLNKDLNLDETDGWMECEVCGEITQLTWDPIRNVLLIVSQDDEPPLKAREVVLCS